MAMRNWLWVAAYLTALVLFQACGSGEPGTPQNHPLIWGVALAAAALGIVGGVAWGKRIERRQDRKGERRADRQERRDERNI